MIKKISFNINKTESLLPIGLIGLIFSIALGFALIGKDMQSLLRWDLALFLLGIIVLPICNMVFNSFRFKGYYFAKVIGLGLSSYIIWLLSDLHIVRFSSLASLMVTFIIGLIIYLAYFIYCKKKENYSLIYEVFTGLFGKASYSIERILISESIFLLLMLACTYLLGQKIPGSDTERFMNYGFMTMLSKCDYMPPKDMWAALESINYYYYGHYMCTFISKLSFVRIAEAYSLSINMIWSFVMTFSFSIVFELLNANEYVKEKASLAGGIIAAIAVGFAGNMHYVIFYKVIPTLWDMLGIEGDKPFYWFASSTRYIGYTPLNTADQTIEEYPSYIILLGDLHAHAIDMMLVLSIIGVLVAYGIWAKQKSNIEDNYSNEKNIIIHNILNLNLIIASFLLALASMTNYWDYPIYLLICCSFILFGNLLLYGNKLKGNLLSISQCLLSFIFSQLLNSLFMKQFDKMFDGIGIVTIRSYLSQLLVLWGLPITCVIIFVHYLFNKKIFGEERAVCENKGLIAIIKGEKISDLIILGLAICAIGLVLIPEFIFVKDIYINGFPRANTMYKLTFEAFILFGLVMGYVFARILFSKVLEDNSVLNCMKGRSIKRTSLLLFILWICTCGYIFTAVVQWMGKSNEREYIGIDSTLTIRSVLERESEAVDWINENLPGDEVILFADGDSYTSSCMIPALTGHPTVLGWNTHEWLWHNSYDYVANRSEDIRNIYQAYDASCAKELLDKYEVEYIYIGSKEYERYENINVSLLISLGHVVYSDNGTGACIIKLN